MIILHLLQYRKLTLIFRYKQTFEEKNFRNQKTWGCSWVDFTSGIRRATGCCIDVNLYACTFLHCTHESSVTWYSVDCVHSSLRLVIAVNVFKYREGTLSYFPALIHGMRNLLKENSVKERHTHRKVLIYFVWSNDVRITFEGIRKINDVNAIDLHTWVHFTVVLCTLVKGLF